VFHRSPPRPRRANANLEPDVEVLPGWEKEAISDDGTIGEFWTGEDEESETTSPAAMVTPAPDLDNAHVKLDRHLHRHLNGGFR
jgi:hypothetical protein